MAVSGKTKYTMYVDSAKMEVAGDRLGLDRLNENATKKVKPTIQAPTVVPVAQAKLAIQEREPKIERKIRVQSQRQ